MPYVVAKFKVNDYVQWRQHFDMGASMRKANGLISEHVFKNEGNPNEVALVFEWQDLEKAKQLMQSPELKERMKESGVEGQPEIFLEAEQKVGV